MPCLAPFHHPCGHQRGVFTAVSVTDHFGIDGWHKYINKDWLDKDQADVGFGNGHSCFVQLLLNRRNTGWIILLAQVQKAEAMKSKDWGHRWNMELNQLTKTWREKAVTTTWHSTHTLIPCRRLANFQPLGALRLGKQQCTAFPHMPHVCLYVPRSTGATD